MWQNYFLASTVDEVLEILAEQGDQARIVAGATDLLLETERGLRHGIKTLVDISKISDLQTIARHQDGNIHIGPLATHNDCVDSPLIRKHAEPLAQACWQVGSPQIRNRGTIAGNLVTASPANDTITPLMALGAAVVLRSKHQQRTVPLVDFYTGVRRTVMQPDEMLVDILFPPMTEQDRGVFFKDALRRAQAISVINVAIILRLKDNFVQTAAITLGAVAPTVRHAEEAEQFLVGKRLDETTLTAAAELAAKSATPIDDVRSSARYRRTVVRVLTSRGLNSLVDHQPPASLPANPVLLQTPHPQAPPAVGEFLQDAPIVTTINGQEYTFTSGHHKSLLHLIREDAGLTGPKEGCGEGECGACTIFLDGMAVMSCLVPAPRAHGSEIVTIEGLSDNGNLHPLQEAFISHGAVQCGFCTPGFIMSGVKLLQEKPHPSRDEIIQAVTGNLCRCTGYYKIIEAIEASVQN